MSESTKVEEILNKLKNNRYISWLIVICIIFLAAVSVAEGIKKAGSIFGRNFAQSQESVRFHADSLDRLLKISKEIDLFYLNLKNEAGAIKFNDFKSQYFEIQSNIDDLVLRNKIFALNPISLKQSKLISENWRDLGIILRNEPSGSNASLEGKQLIIETSESAIKQGIEAVLMYEYEKSKEPNKAN